MPQQSPPTRRPWGLARIAWSLLAAALGASLGAFVLLRSQLPQISSLQDYAPPQASKVFSDEGHLIGQFYKERRTVVSFAQIPKHVVAAFLAAEDVYFYSHEGLDYVGIMRAFFKNLRPGAHLQGASTITQQTVKTLILGPERSLLRKIREALLARQLEQLLSKEDILTLYLNQIYFGHGAFGIEEAARTYFGCSVSDLTLAQGALLAATPKSPSKYNIKTNPAAARQRQRHILEQMREHQFASEAELEAAFAEPLRPPPPAVSQAELAAADYVEQIRRLLLPKYGEQQLFGGGLRIYTGANLQAQQAAVSALRAGLEDLTQRQGMLPLSKRIARDGLQEGLRTLRAAWQLRLDKAAAYAPAPAETQTWLWDLREVSLPLSAVPAALARQLREVPLLPGQRLTVPVVRFVRAANEALLDLGGGVLGRLPLAKAAWARPFAPTEFSRKPRAIEEVVQIGDLVTVEITHMPPPPVLPPEGGALAPIEVALVPTVKAQGAVVAISTERRLVRALVGGMPSADDAAGSARGFLRAMQAKRQPGSAFKPFVYAAALASREMTPASLCPDSPIVIHDPWTGEAWKPDNFEGGRYDGNITYRQALARSKNTCSVRLLQKITPQAVIDTARQLGLQNSLPNNYTLALGTGEMTPFELTAAMAAIADLGAVAEPMFVVRILDGNGSLLEEGSVSKSKGIEEEVASLLSHMLTSVVSEGTGRRAQFLGRPVAGKTGTSQDYRDAWFTGFTPDLVATVWMGFDDNASLGRTATGGSVALPTWVRFMGMALEESPVQEFTLAQGLVSLPCDPSTGQPSDSPLARPEWFLPGTEPKVEEAALPGLFIDDE